MFRTLAILTAWLVVVACNSAYGIDELGYGGSAGTASASGANGGAGAAAPGGAPAGMGGAAGAGGANGGAGGGQVDQRTIRYVVHPHPDDEYEGWSHVDGATDRYVVFVLLTRGEASGYCTGQGFDTGTGEREPQPPGFQGRWSAACAAQRLDSWHYFLDTMTATANPELGAVAFVRHYEASGLAGTLPPQRCDSLDPAPYSNCSESRGYDLWLGPGSARVAFDLGDGDLTADEVAWALEAARALRVELPVQAEHDIVGASYRNAVAAHGVVYDHPDHHAVHTALWEVDFGLPGPQLAATALGDPDGTITALVSLSTHDAAWGLGANDYREGAAQVAYGWLASGYWTACTASCGCLFCSEQRYWSRF
ncbi:MAG: hypothetical protein JRI23_10890 [Deltaproteobacteria bacterium]|nr:hypothetical protein [Deltaproteobacteria bacterium]MBW2532187.1 hypothetical protein [Deltaproteobacteria bacterium]